MEPDGGPRRPSGVRRWLCLLPFCLVLITACSASPATSSLNGVPAASARPSLSLASPDPMKSVGDLPGAGDVHSGILSSDSIEGGCAYLQATDGRRLEVIYPEG